MSKSTHRPGAAGSHGSSDPTSAPRATSRRAVLALAAAALGASAGLGVEAARAGKLPEDILAGQLIVSDSSFPTRWTSPSEFANACKKKRKDSLHFAKKTENSKTTYPPVQIYYAAFFQKPVPDVEVRFVLYDITNGIQNKAKKGSWEAFLSKKGDRVLFNSVELDKEDLFGDDTATRKYMFAIEYRGQILAKSEMKLTAEAQKFSGKVEFSDEDTKKRE